MAVYSENTVFIAMIINLQTIIPIIYGFIKFSENVTSRKNSWTSDSYILGVNVTAF